LSDNFNFEGFQIKHCIAFKTVGEIFSIFLASMTQSAFLAILGKTWGRGIFAVAG
jgi:hypothetical protein